MLLCLQLFLVICSGAMISKVGAEFLLPPQPIPAESHPTHRGAAVQLSEGRSANELWEFGGSGGQTPPLYTEISSWPWDLGVTGSPVLDEVSAPEDVGRCCVHVGAIGLHIGHIGLHLDVLLHVGPTLARAWGRLATCWAHSGAMLADLRQIRLIFTPSWPPPIAVPIVRSFLFMPQMLWLSQAFLPIEIILRSSHT